MQVMTFDKAVSMYRQLVREAADLLLELKTMDCPPLGSVHEQEGELRRLTLMRDRCQIIHDRMAKKSSRK